MAPSSPPTLLTVKQFSNRHPAFSEGSLRWMIFKAGAPDNTTEDTKAKALNQALVRIGRRVLINEKKFFEWALSGDAQ